MLKKDATTKLKALSEFRAVLEGDFHAAADKIAVLFDAAPHWVYLYLKYRYDSTSLSIFA